MTDIMKEIFAGIKANQDVYRVAYDEGFKAGMAKCRRMITDLCSALDDLAPDEGEDRYDAEYLIAAAKAMLDGEVNDQT